jgi:hypothetical protein
MRVISRREVGIQMTVSKSRCSDCDEPSGKFHEMFCTKERCPFCGGQLASCDCIFEQLALSPSERTVVEEYVDDSVEPLKGITKRWIAAIRKKGRIPVK